MSCGFPLRFLVLLLKYLRPELEFNLYPHWELRSHSKYKHLLRSPGRKHQEGKLEIDSMGQLMRAPDGGYRQWTGIGD